MLKSLVTLTRMGHEMERQRDLEGDLARMQGAMASASATLSVLAATTSSTVAIDGTPATATIVALRATGSSIGLDPIVELDLVVTVGSAPMPVTVTRVVPQLQLHKAQPGLRLAVKIGATPTELFVDWLQS